MYASPKLESLRVLLMPGNGDQGLRTVGTHQPHEIIATPTRTNYIVYAWPEANRVKVRLVCLDPKGLGEEAVSDQHVIKVQW